MKIAIYGAGAIGGFLGVKLAQAGAEVTMIARGPHLAAMRDHGVTLVSGTDRVTLPLRCIGDPGAAGPQDYVFITLKAPALSEAAPQIARLMAPHTTLVTGINGIPYWYFYGMEGPWRDRVVESVDPGGMLWRHLHPSSVLHAIVYPAAEITAPGIITHRYGDRFTLGEPDGSRSERAEALARLMIAAGLKAPVRPRIRDEIWVKLWGNMAFNPISALTGATLDRLTARPDLRAACRGLMLEGRAVAEALGVRFAIDVEKRIDGAGEVGIHKTSMLQDLERGRPLEIDALLGAVVELAGLVGQNIPQCQTVLALLRERARLAGCYPAA
ncbi:MAG: 2-dehydropantoate 2-reductase [Aliidongia sp.]|nr:2-dehydropantoate 2-reductase [Aliidongia sp.]